MCNGQVNVVLQGEHALMQTLNRRQSMQCGATYATPQVHQVDCVCRMQHSLDVVEYMVSGALALHQVRQLVATGTALQELQDHPPSPSQYNCLYKVWSYVPSSQ